VQTTVLVVGDRDGAANKASFFVSLVPSKQRVGNTSQFKDKLREQLKTYAYATPKVKDFDAVGGGMRPFTLNIIGPELKELERIGGEVLARLKKSPALKDVDVSFRPGKPEFQVAMDLRRAERLGVSSSVAGAEVRNLLEGTTPAVFRERGEEYDIRIRLREDQRDLEASFKDIYVPNVNMSLVKLSNVATPVRTAGPSNIDRLDRGRFVQIGADIAPGGPGMGGAINEVNKMFAEEIKLPPGYRFSFTGQAENFKELAFNMLVAAGLGILFIYLVLASLYESFVTPFTIMLVLPLAACGAFYALWMTGASLDLFSMIGCVMLLGIATKNSILLVDYANQKIAEGVDRGEAMLQAGKTRLRPILMTSFALIAGMIPLAIGLNEAAKQRTSLGIAVIGGIVSSTLLTLVVVPASFAYIDRFRVWALATAKRIFAPKGPAEHVVEDKPAIAD
jgi:hydrophobic/amphiphilic exporter-1 (mainly G- bacteria), HAE1 family